MIQRGNGARLALEASTQVVALGGMFRLTLMATVRSSLVSRALYTSTMPPAPIGEMISYGPSFSLGERGMRSGLARLT